MSNSKNTYQKSSVKLYICPECGKPCDAIECDDGIGPFEFWGRKGWDSRPYMGSDCCEAELDDVEFPDDEGAKADWLYDCAKDDRLTND